MSTNFGELHRPKHFGRTQNTGDDLKNLRERIISGGSSHSSKSSFRESNELDTEVLNRACSASDSSDRITSNYWKIPDQNYSYLTAMSSHNDKPYLAISNSASDSNLLIYELDVDYKLLSHHQSITLPDITSLRWLDSAILANDTKSNDDINFLLTGHGQGSVHLSIIPEPENDVFTNAEIIKKFNHNKQVETDDLSLSSAITKLDISPRRWKSCTINSMFSAFKSNLFMWDTTRSRAPILKHKSVGLRNFHPSPCNDGLLGICGEYGIALLDLRAADGSPSLYVPDFKNSGVADNIKWSPFDSNVLASSYEADGVVRLWDVRMTKNSFAKLEGHRDSVTSIEWSETATNDLFTASKDGTIIHWNLSDVGDKYYYNDTEELRCCLRQGLDSLNLVKQKDGRIELANDLARTRQCGTSIPASANGVVDMININDGKILSIDGSSYLGLHNKTQLASSSDSMMHDILHTIGETLSVSDSNSQPSVEFPTTPEAQKFSFNIQDDYASLPPPPLSPASSTSAASQRISSAETLVNSSPAMLKRQSHYETLPLPNYTKHSHYQNNDSVTAEQHDTFRRHRKHDSLSKHLMSKLRDFSGATLNHAEEEEDEDLLTDLTIEDDFTFKPVFPLALNNRSRTAF